MAEQPRGVITDHDKAWLKRELEEKPIQPEAEFSEIMRRKFEHRFPGAMDKAISLCTKDLVESQELLSAHGYIVLVPIVGQVSGLRLVKAADAFGLICDLLKALKEASQPSLAH